MKVHNIHAYVWNVGDVSQSLLCSEGFQRGTHCSHRKFKFAEFLHINSFYGSCQSSHKCIYYILLICRLHTLASLLIWSAWIGNYMIICSSGKSAAFLDSSNGWNCNHKAMAEFAGKTSKLFWHCPRNLLARLVSCFDTAHRWRLAV